MLFGYLLQLYILAVGYLYPLTHYIYQSQAEPSDPHFVKKDWTQYFATITVVSIVDGMVGPIFSLLFFPWYALIHLSLITALATMKDLDQQIFQVISSIVIGNRALFENMESFGKTKVVGAWQSGFSLVWSGTTKFLLNTRTRLSTLTTSKTKKN